MSYLEWVEDNRIYPSRYEYVPTHGLVILKSELLPSVVDKLNGHLYHYFLDRPVLCCYTQMKDSTIMMKDGVSEHLNPFRLLAYQLMRRAGWSVRPDRGMIRSVRALVDGTHSEGSIIDNECYEIMNTKTCMFMMQRTKGIMGGNFIYEQRTEHCFWNEVIDHSISVCPGTILLWDGELSHRIQECCGYGTISYVTVSLEYT